MPLIDVSLVLRDPNLIDSLWIHRRTEVVNNFGISTTTTELLSAYGIAYPATDNDLKRFPDLQIQGKSIVVITQFMLRGESQLQGSEFQPDVVVWNGNNFVVKALEDYSLYGRGFVFAICASMDLVDAYPIPQNDGGFGVGTLGS